MVRKILAMLLVSTIPLAAGCFVDADDDKDTGAGDDDCVTACTTDHDDCVSECDSDGDCITACDEEYDCASVCAS